MPSYRSLKPLFCLILFALAVPGTSTARHNSILSRWLFQVDSLGHPKAYKDELKFSLVHFIIPRKDYTKELQNELGISYERQILKHWKLGVGYYYWRHISREEPSKHTGIYEGIASIDPKVGDLYYRLDYKLWDLYILYRLIPTNSHHKLNVGIGLSYISGKNEYVSSYFRYPYFPYESFIDYSVKMEGYFGIVPQLNYSYLFFKNRLDAGIDIKRRFYFSWSQPYYEVAVHIGINF